MGRDQRECWKLATGSEDMVQIDDIEYEMEHSLSCSSDSLVIMNQASDETSKSLSIVLNLRTTLVLVKRNIRPI